VTIDHTCPVDWAARRGLLVGSPVERTWCLTMQRKTLMGLQVIDAKAPELLLWRDDSLSIYFAPFDWVNREAKIMLVGITPGHHQATEALKEARRCLDAGLPNEEALRCADAVGSFSGPMRTNLVTMLDGIGIGEALEIETTARLFDTHHHLAAHASAIDYPVFLNNENYGGTNPSLVGHNVLSSLVRACLGARVAMAPDALIVPLGKAAQDAVKMLADQGLLDRRRCLLGFPHPSGANGWRTRQYAERQMDLQKAVTTWASNS
jgi:hypothetical protein